MTLGLLMATMAFGVAAANHEEGMFGDELFTDDVGDFDEPQVSPFFAECTDDNGHVLSAVSDIDASREVGEERDQFVDIEEDDVLLGIALANNGWDGIDFNSLRDVTLEETAFAVVAQDTDLDREDVFSALALGLDSDTSSLGALECVSNVDSAVAQTTTASQDVDLDEDTVLLAIALENSVGHGSNELEDVASISTDVSTTLDRTQDVDIDRTDTFLALALGAGGSGSGSFGGSFGSSTGDAHDDALDDVHDDALGDETEDVLEALS